MAQERNKITGGCACGDVRFGFYAPLVFRGACHCRACQYTSGGGPAYLVGAAKAQFRITRGHPAEFTTLSDAGHLVTRVFCAGCGTHLYSISENAPDVCSVKVGALDESARFKPKAHLWTSEAPAWHKFHRFTRRYRKNSPTRRRRSPDPGDAAV